MKQKQVEWTFEQRVAIDGRAHTEECMMLLIREGRDIPNLPNIPAHRRLSPQTDRRSGEFFTV